MKRFILLFITMLLLTSCEGLWLIRIDRYEPDDTSTSTSIPTDNPTDIATGTYTPTATNSPTVVPSATNTPTQAPTDPTPTREALNQVTTLVRLNLRSTPEIATNVIRVTNVGETFTAFQICNGFIDVGTGWLSYRQDWISGDISQLPACTLLSNVGYNILDVSNKDYAFSYWLDLCPAYLLFMDNFALAIEAYNLLNPACGTQIIHRDWHPSDGEEYLVRTPEDFVARWIQQGHTEIIRYSTNEASCGNDECRRYVAHEVALAKLARQNGFTVALGNTGVGKFSPNAVMAGVYTPLVKAAFDYRHLLGFHEYTTACLCFGFGQMPTSWLNDPVRMQVENWSRNVEYAFAPLSAQTVGDELPFGQEMMLQYYAENAFMAQAINEVCGTLPSYWHLGRSFWILLWAECTAGIDTSLIPIVHTEFGLDRLDDVASTMKPLEAVYGLPQYNNDLRGWQSYRSLWAWYWQDWTTAEAMYNQLTYATSLYPSNHYFLLFAWTDNCNRDWYRAGFGFGNCSSDGTAQQFHNLTRR